MVLLYNTQEDQIFVQAYNEANRPASGHDQGAMLLAVFDYSFAYATFESISSSSCSHFKSLSFVVENVTAFCPLQVVL